MVQIKKYSNVRMAQLKSRHKSNGEPVARFVKMLLKNVLHYIFLIIILQHFETGRQLLTTLYRFLVVKPQKVRNVFPSLQ